MQVFSMQWNIPNYQLQMDELLDFGAQYHWTMDAIIIPDDGLHAHAAALGLSDNTICISCPIRRQMVVPSSTVRPDHLSRCMCASSLKLS